MSEASGEETIARPVSVAKHARLGGPVTYAFALSVIALPAVAWSLLQRPPEWQLANDGFIQGPLPWRPMTVLQAVVLAFAAVSASALVAGWAGGRVWRRSKMSAVFVAMSLAWATALVVLPVGATIVGAPLRTGLVCTFGCEALLRDDQPLSGFRAVGLSIAGAIVLAECAVVPAIVLIVARRLASFALSVVAVIAAHGSLHLWVIIWSTGGLVPYVALAVGVGAWALLLRSRESPEPHKASPSR